MTRRGIGLLVLAAVAGTALWFLTARRHVPRRVPPPARAEHFLLIVCDSLRADHVGCYGSRQQLTPNIDALARRAVRFANAYAASSWTCPSNAALVTGRYPREVQERGKMRLAGEAMTLAEHFRDSGFSTAGFSSHALFSGRHGFDQGFQWFVCWRRQDDEVAAKCARWMSAHKDEPFFVMLYLLDPHWPYDPEKAGARWRPRNANVRKRVAQGNIPLAEDVRVPRLVSQPLGDREMSMEEVSYLHALYDGDVASVDDRIGRVLRGVRGIGDLVVTVTSDHGEEWLDHGGLSHLYTLYDELLRIPLIVSAPGLAPQTVSAPVSNLDLAPTLLALAGLRAPGNLRGVNLLPADKLGARALTAEVHGWHPLGVSRFSVRLGTQTLICTMTGLPEERKAPPGGRFERYDLASDPGERHPLALGDPQNDPLGRLMRASNPFASRAGRLGEPLKLDARTIEELRALGYLQR